jgi:hypothetical protein
MSIYSQIQMSKLNRCMLGLSSLSEPCHEYHEDDHNEPAWNKSTQDEFGSAISTEGERKNLRAGIEKFNVEMLVRDPSRLPDQLIEALPGNRAPSR